MYTSGKSKVEYAHLQFESFNQSYFDALVELKQQDEQADAAKKEKRKQEDGASTPTKANKLCKLDI